MGWGWGLGEQRMGLMMDFHTDGGKGGGKIWLLISSHTEEEGTNWGT